MPKPDRDRSQPMARIAIASAVGTTVEFYDFFIFGTAAALVFGTTFFPALGPAAGTLASLATFGVAFVARPFGSILFGHFGDRLGRKTTLVGSLMLMGASTVAIGLLPTAESIGVAAPILLVLLRLLQGIAVGGEWAGAVLLTGEHAPAHQRGAYATFPQLGPSLAFVLTSATFLTTSLLMTPEQFLDFGWRIPFLASALLVVIGLYVRLKIAETPAFVDVAASGRTAKVPFLEVIRQQPREVILGAGSVIMVFAFFHTGVTYLTTYGTAGLELPRTTVLAIGIPAGLIFAAVTGIAAYISDRVGRRIVVLVAIAVAIPWSLALFPVINNGTPFAFAVGITVTLAIVGIGYGPAGAQLPELFQARFRYTGAGVAYSIGGVIGGGLAPIVSAWLESSYGSGAIGVYLAVVSALSLVSVALMRETGRGESADDPSPIPLQKDLDEVAGES